jgi:hypothetical protein
MKQSEVIVHKEFKPSTEVLKKANEFVKIFKNFESKSGIPQLLYYDKRSNAYYLICHLESKVLSSKSDIDAVLDPIESEEYKLNRNIYTDNYAYRLMEADAINGRSFEDIVVEYDSGYRPDKPLKVFGGQHRITAIQEAAKKNVTTIHGVRVYFGLTIDQRYNIAAANNTSITIPNDLLDRMQEELLGSELRDWCQSVGLLDKGQNFTDKRSPEGIPTVRIARTLIVNFYRGKAAKNDDFHMPIVCSSGTGIDKSYKEVRDKINWSDNELKDMGKQFVKLHRIQRDKVLNRSKDKHLEFANKTIHPCVVASWAYAAGLFQKEPNALQAHYALVDIIAPDDDPLNAKELSQARLKGTDPDTYRGLGARINSEELGRMFALFLLQATKASKRGINKKLADAAIKSYIAAKKDNEAKKALKGI